MPQQVGHCLDTAGWAHWCHARVGRMSGHAVVYGSFYMPQIWASSSGPMEDRSADLWAETSSATGITPYPIVAFSNADEGSPMTAGGVVRRSGQEHGWRTVAVCSRDVRGACRRCVPTLDRITGGGAQASIDSVLQSFPSAHATAGATAPACAARRPAPGRSCRSRRCPSPRYRCAGSWRH